MEPTQSEVKEVDASNTPDQTNNLITEPTISEAPQTSASPNPPLPPEKKWYSNKVLYVVLITVLVIGGVFAWALISKKPKNAVNKTTSSIKKTTTTSKASPYFYLAADTKSISVYNPDTKTKFSISITAGKDEELIGGSTSSNRPIQISSNGQVVAYSTGKDKSCGEGGCEITDTYIYVKGAGAAEQIVKISQPQMIDDFALSPDGKSIFYLINKDSSKAADFDLHKITIGDKKDTLIKQNLFGLASVIEKTQMFALSSDSIRVYDNQTDVKEYSYVNGNVTSRNLGVSKFCSDCRVEYGQPLSPDGKTLILESGDTSSTFSYYTLDLTNGNHKQIVKTAKTTEQLLSVFWSPDGRSIAYDITSNGIAGQNEVGFKFRFEIYDITTGKKTIGPADMSPGVSDKNYSNHFVMLLGWSPDGSYIATANEGKIKLYKLTDNSTTTTDITTDNPIGSNAGFGWFSK